MAIVSSRSVPCDFSGLIAVHLKVAFEDKAPGNAESEQSLLCKQSIFGFVGSVDIEVASPVSKQYVGVDDGCVQ